jgi:hypothetical protein
VQSRPVHATRSKKNFTKKGREREKEIQWRIQNAEWRMKNWKRGPEDSK